MRQIKYFKKINSTFKRDETADLFGNYSQHRGCFS